uniref:Uncharacterized protein n=1 Tax=Oryza sativa subsp. japonica TaxID=39947 RepID=Q2QVG5_ORYSJ|nr:hypothetical protein LOC_Os12g12889 [Oryza sativa Japonica Group]
MENVKRRRRYDHMQLNRRFSCRLTPAEKKLILKGPNWYISRV